MKPNLKQFLFLALLVLFAILPSQAQQKLALSAAGTDCTTAGACLTVGLTETIQGGAIQQRYGAVTITVGANASGNTLQFEATGDGTLWVALNAYPSNSTTGASSTTGTGVWQANVAGYTSVRVRMSTLSGGTSTVSIVSSTASASSGRGGGTSFDPTKPGPIGGTTPAAGTFTTLGTTSAASFKAGLWVDVTSYGAKCDNSTDDAAALAAAFTAAASNWGRVFIPQGTCITNTALVVPNKVHLFGTQGGDISGVGSVIKAGASFPVSTAVLTMGSSSTNRVQITDLTVDCNAKAGSIGISNTNAQEESFVQRTTFQNCAAIGLDVEGSGAQNSGPYSELEFESLAAGVANTLCIKINNVLIRAVRGWTCNQGGYSVIPNAGVLVDGAPNGPIEDGHCESVVDCIYVGSLLNTYGFSAKNIIGNSTVTNVIHLVAAATHNVYNYKIEDLVLNSASVGILDGQRNVSVSGTQSAVAFYACGDDFGAQKSCLSELNAGPVQLVEPLKFLGSTGNAYTIGPVAGNGTDAVTFPDANGGTVCLSNSCTLTNAKIVNLVASSTAPTIGATHFNTSGDSISANNGTAAFTVTVGTSTATQTGILTMPAATTGWNCFANNLTRAALIRETATGTTSVTLTNYAASAATPTNWTNSDVIAVSCFAY